MKLTMTHADLEEAVRDFVQKNGITQNVSEISFTVARASGNSVTTEITLGSQSVASQPSVTPVRAVPDAVDTTEAADSDDAGDDASESTSLFG